MSWSKEDYAAAYLSYLFEPGNKLLNQLIRKEGLVEVASCLNNRLVPEGYSKLLELTENKHDSTSWIEVVEKYKAKGGNIINRESTDWPGWELLCCNDDYSESNYPKFTPFVLWYMGDKQLLNYLTNSIAIVGTRAGTEYGRRATELFCGEFSKEEITTISGGAVGVDSWVHKSALLTGGRTISILANGLLDPYPKRNYNLFTKLIETNLILSEYFPDTKVAKHRFLIRNRIVAALSNYLLIIESGKRSGTANTAAWARRLGKIIYAIPGSIYAKESVGCNKLIAGEEAYLAMDPIDLVKQIKMLP